MMLRSNAMLWARVIGPGVLFGASIIAQAGTMTFLGGDPLQQSATIGGAHLNGTIMVGLMDFSETTFGDIKSFCVDLDHGVNPGQVWPDTIWDAASYSDPGIQRAANLVAADYAQADTADKAAGLQLDIWETIYDGNSETTPDFSGGNFTATGLTAGTIAAADAFWADRLTPGDAVYIRPEDGFGQGQIMPVPEPASLSILGLGAIALLRRRRART